MEKGTIEKRKEGEGNLVCGGKGTRIHHLSFEKGKENSFYGSVDKAIGGGGEIRQTKKRKEGDAKS